MHLKASMVGSGANQKSGLGLRKRLSGLGDVANGVMEGLFFGVFKLELGQRIAWQRVSVETRVKSSGENSVRIINLFLLSPTAREDRPNP